MRAPTLMLALTAILIPITGAAQERRLDIGVRLAIDAAHGVPANDIPGAGVLAHYVLNEAWTLGAAVDRTEYDFEEPAKIVGIAQDPTLGPIDALAEATTVRLWIERTLGNGERKTTFFVGAGMGAAFTDVPDVSGARADGGSFDIHTEVDTELLASAVGGARRRFSDRWYGEIALHLEQHFAHWRTTDRVSGAEGSIDDYLTWGAHIAFGRRW